MNNPQKLPKAKNVVIRAYYFVSDEKLDDDSGLDKRGQQFIYGKSHSRNFVRSQQVAAIWNNKHPTFFDEIKVRLPMDFQLEKHHIVFAVYHVGGKLKKDEVTFLGFGFLPLVGSDGRILDDGEHAIPVWRTLDPNYLKQQEDASKAPAVLQVCTDKFLLIA